MKTIHPFVPKLASIIMSLLISALPASDARASAEDGVDGFLNGACESTKSDQKVGYGRMCQFTFADHWVLCRSAGPIEYRLEYKARRNDPYRVISRRIDMVDGEWCNKKYNLPFRVKNTGYYQARVKYYSPDKLHQVSYTIQFAGGLGARVKYYADEKGFQSYRFQVVK